MPENYAETHRNIEFNNNVTATLRTEPGMLYPLAGSRGNYSGSKAARIENRFGRIRMAPRGERNGDTNNVDMSSLARFIKVGPSHNVAPLIDRDDQSVTEVDLNSPAVKETAAAAATYHDDQFGIGYFGNGLEGEAGDVAVPFKAANVIAAAATPLSLPKLIAMRQLMRKRNAPWMRERPVILLMPEDESALLNINEYKNADFNESKPLANGEIKPFMGFRFFSFNPDTDSLPLSFGNYFSGGGATRRLPAFFPSGLHHGIWTEFWGKIEPRSDKQYSEQIYGEARSAIVRTDEDLCFILETTG
jgi:hypothetical protein